MYDGMKMLCINFHQNRIIIFFLNFNMGVGNHGEPHLQTKTILTFVASEESNKKESPKKRNKILNIGRRTILYRTFLYSF